MATVTGTVTSIQVVPDNGLVPVTTYACVAVGGQTGETLILWMEPVTVFTPPGQWIARSSALSLLRDLLINDLTVTITTTSATSANIETVTLGGVI